MVIRVKIIELSQAWLKSSVDFYFNHKDLFNNTSPEDFYKKFGEEYGFEVRLKTDKISGHYVLDGIDYIEFADEQAYAWFMLKWS